LQQDKGRVITGLVLVQVFFSTLPVAAKIALRDFSSSSLAFLRVLIASAVFLLIHRLTVREPIRSKADYIRLAWYSVLGVSLTQLLYIIGVSMTTATAAQMLIAGGPAVTLLIAIVLGKEKASAAKWFGIACAAAGAALLVGGGFGNSKLIGNVMILINMIAYSLYLVSARDILQRYHPLTVITWIFLFGIVGLLPIGMLPAIHEFGAASNEAKLALLWIIIFPTVCAYYLNVWALTHVESSLVSAFVYLQPVMTAVLAAWILGEHPSPRMLPSAVLIFAGVGFALWSTRRADHQPHPEEQLFVEP
jgi:drug/metabolite transporter (DMT)-like permease